MPSPPAPIKPGVIKDPAVAALFSNKDPEARYNDLREIGHGSFGAVYFAFDKDKSETVAIKKMAFNGKQASEKWTDILKEVAFLNKISHPNIVQYKACFLKEHTCWLVMEYCIGSTADVVDVLRRGLREVEISEICSQTLQALHYLHSLKRIHRDIKAGNILLSDQAVIKLADFGSASLANPAQTFIGTPFFMAPEVILAMDEGHYNEKADIWSLGITCIELAERRPPLFNMNAMSALYHIAQNEPPTLSPIINDDQPEWTDTFQSFISKCLCKEPDERMTTSECMSHPFIACQRPRDTISELISRSKNKVMELDNFQYKKMRKLMYLDEAEGRDGDDGFGSGSGAGSEDMDFSNSGVDALSVDRGDSTSSRSASLTSFKSSSGTGGAGRRPPIPSSMRDPMDNNNGRSESELKNRTLIPVGDLSADSEKECGTGSTRPPSPLAAPMRTDPQHIKDDMATLRKSKFATLRSAKLISKEQEEYTKENNMYEQMSGYKRLRQGHHKELKQMEEKQGTETEALKVKLDKELEQLHASSGKEKQRVKMSHQSDLERKKKDVEDGERKLKKQIVAKQGPEMRAFSTLQLKEYKHNKELAKSSMKERGMRGGDYEIAVKNLKSSLSRARAQSEAAFEAKLRNESEMEIGRYKRAQLSSLHSLEERLNEEELDLLERQAETRQAMMLRHHDVTRQMEMGHTREMHALKKKHQDTQHEAESTNQSDYNRRLKEELHKKHALQSRQQPRELKLKEAQIRKQYRQAVKTQTRQFKLWQTQVLQAAPREEQKDIEKRLKEEQKRKIALLASQYDSQIENMVQEKTVKLESWQIEEEKHLNEKLAKELEELRAYQTRQRDMLESMIHKERCQLDERISVRRALLDSRAAEERAEILRLRESRRASLASRQLDEKRRMEEETGHSTTL